MLPDYSERAVRDAISRLLANSPDAEGMQEVFLLREVLLDLGCDPGPIEEIVFHARDIADEDDSQRKEDSRGLSARKGMDDKLRSLLQDLGNAINESLCESRSIGSAMEEAKKAGYDVFLVLEATIGFNKREDGDDGLEMSEEELNAPSQTDRRKRRRADAPPTKGGKINLTNQDEKFLRALKISTDNPE